MTDTRL